MIETLQNILGYHFNDHNLLIEALSHPSLHGNTSFNGSDYERLEFLGDSVINLAITHILYNQYPHEPEGNLAKMRSYLVSKDIMVKIAQNIELGKYIIMGFSEEASDGRHNPNNLENILEAIFGAIYLDSNIDITINIIYKFWQPCLNKNDIYNSDPKSRLQEIMQKDGLGLPHYILIKKDGPAHAPIFCIKCDAGTLGHATAEGKSIKVAEKEAAEKILDKIKK